MTSGFVKVGCFHPKVIGPTRVIQHVAEILFTSTLNCLKSGKIFPNCHSGMGHTACVTYLKHAVLLLISVC